ncbi:chaperone NapD [Iodobacter ciconiae]|nr:chaperone NapD [Iodobacter ciconiae]
MNIFSLVIRAVPDHLENVRAAVLLVQGVELHLEHEGRLIITVEDVPGVRSSDLLKQIQDIPHVASATLAYEYCDEELSQSPLLTSEKSEERLS